MVGVCLLVQPELVVGAVIVIGAVIVAVAITAELENIKTRALPCLHIGTKGEGSGNVICIYLCGTEQRLSPRRGTSAACMGNIPTYIPN